MVFILSYKKIRKTLERDNRKPKKWLANHFVPFFPLWQTRIIENKKKSIFFLLCLGLFTYYDGYSCINIVNFRCHTKMV